MNKKVGIIVGSTRPTRIGLQIAKWTKTILDKTKIQYDIIDLAKINLPMLDEPEMPMKGNYQKDHTIKWQHLIDSYEGIIFLFPQYNWGLPAPLKNAIDYLGSEWRDKPVACITYGFHGGNQAYSTMLLVMNALKMKRMAVNPPLNINGEMFDDKNNFKDIDKAFTKESFSIQLLGKDFENILK